MKFLHAADLHIDSPLRGLDTQEAPVERLRAATRRATEAMVDLAIQQQVDCVVLAGDIFDGPWPDMRTGIWTAQQFGRLDAHDIPVYMLRGNHDAESKVRQAVDWPSNVHEFGVERPETFIMSRSGVALHGQGFAHPSVSEDLAANYPAARSGMLNIGVLHTSLTGHVEHDDYAPTSETILRSKGYDYWALGHIHQRRVVQERDPCIVYSGNTQGRHIRETGAKGCYVVELQPGSPPHLQFHSTDVARWFEIVIQASPDDELDGLLDAAETELDQCISEAEMDQGATIGVGDQGKLVVARVTLQGACRAHEQLMKSMAATDEATAKLRSRCTLRGNVWLEKIRWRLHPVVDLKKLREGQDLLGELLRDLQAALHPGELPNDESTDALISLHEALLPLQQMAPKTLDDAGVQFEDPAQIAVWLEQAEGMLVAMLQEGAAR